MQALRHAPLPASEAKARVSEKVERLAKEGVPQIDLSAGRTEIYWPDEMRCGASDTAFSAPSGSASRLMCWLHKDTMIKHLTAGIDHEGGVPAAERAAYEAELRRDLLELELREEELILQALEKGFEVHRRLDGLAARAARARSFRLAAAGRGGRVSLPRRLRSGRPGSGSSSRRWRCCPRRGHGPDGPLGSCPGKQRPRAPGRQILGRALGCGPPRVLLDVRVGGHKEPPAPGAGGSLEM